MHGKRELMLSPAIFQLKNVKWLALSLLLLFLNFSVLWLWVNFLTLRYQRYLMYLGYLPVNSRSRVQMPQIRPPFHKNDDDEDGSEEKITISSQLSNMVESFYIKSMDGTMLHAHFYEFPSNGRYSIVKDGKHNKSKKDTKSVPTLLVFHGTSGNIGHRISYAHTLSSLCQCNVMLINCRGYGLSEG